MQQHNVCELANDSLDLARSGPLTPQQASHFVPDGGISRTRRPQNVVVQRMPDQILDCAVILDFARLCSQTDKVVTSQDRIQRNKRRFRRSNRLRAYRRHAPRALTLCSIWPRQLRVTFQILRFWNAAAGGRRLIWYLAKEQQVVDDQGMRRGGVGAVNSRYALTGPPRLGPNDWLQLANECRPRPGTSVKHALVSRLRYAGRGTKTHRQRC